MNRFDSSVLLWFNHLACRYPGLDSAVQVLADCDLLKGEAFMLVFCWFWFVSGNRRQKNREIILATFAGVILGNVVNLILIACLPFRIRPAFDPNLAFRPAPAASLGLRTWSAFPSDQAMLFAALATGLFFISPEIGTAAYIYAIVFIDIPRIFLGLHHPTDVLAGAVLGTGVVCAINFSGLRRAIASRGLEFLRNHVGAFYMAAFFLSVQIVTTFSEPRRFLAVLVRLAKSIA